ncbi:MAG: hypothetical protein U0234_22900 [Sandaracinus sp.]
MVFVPENRHAIKPADGFVKKQLADDHLELVARCELACTYCSTDKNRWQCRQKPDFERRTAEQLGTPQHGCDHTKPLLAWKNILAQLEDELRSPRAVGTRKTLMFSMLTDPFSPWLVENGITRRALELLIERSEYRIRVLTKSVLVAKPEFVELFAKHSDRIVVGLSVGSLDPTWARQVERRVPAPLARVRALHALQDAGVTTYGMLCPVFPCVLSNEGVDALVDALRLQRCETVWAEPFNSRSNWRDVRDAHPPADRTWFDAAFPAGRTETDVVWSRYATDLYLQLRDAAARGGWSERLRYLLYEGRITEQDAPAFHAGIADGTVLLQGKPDETGVSCNAAIAAGGRRRRLEVHS